MRFFAAENYAVTAAAPTPSARCYGVSQHEPTLPTFLFMYRESQTLAPQLHGQHKEAKAEPMCIQLRHSSCCIAAEETDHLYRLPSRP